MESSESGEGSREPPHALGWRSAFSGRLCCCVLGGVFLWLPGVGRLSLGLSSPLETADSLVMSYKEHNCSQQEAQQTKATTSKAVEALSIAQVHLHGLLPVNDSARLSVTSTALFLTMTWHRTARADFWRLVNYEFDLMRERELAESEARVVEILTALVRLVNRQDDNYAPTGLDTSVGQRPSHGEGILTWQSWY